MPTPHYCKHIWIPYRWIKGYLRDNGDDCENQLLKTVICQLCLKQKDL